MEELNFLKQFSDFEKSVESINQNLSLLGEGTARLSENINKLEALGTLSREIGAMDEHMEKLGRYNQSLKEAYECSDRFTEVAESAADLSEIMAAIAAEVSATQQALSGIEGKETLAALKDCLFQIDTLKNHSLLLQEEAARELNEIQKAFAAYQQESTNLLQEVTSQNRTLQESLRENIQSNAALLAFLSEYKENQAQNETFVKDFIAAWYKENVGFLGNLKKK